MRFMKKITAFVLVLSGVLGVVGLNTNASGISYYVVPDEDSGIVLEGQLFGEEDELLNVSCYGSINNQTEIKIPYEINYPFTDKQKEMAGFTSKLYSQDAEYIESVKASSYPQKVHVDTISSFHIFNSNPSLYDNSNLPGAVGTWGYKIDESNYDLDKTAAIKSITLSEGIAKIGNEAFKDCKSLEKINFPKSLTDVAYNAFDGTAWLDNQPEGVLYINDFVFGYKSGSSSSDVVAEIKKGTKSISAGAFKNHTEISEIIIPDSVIKLGDGAFEGCNNLKELYIPSSITETDGNPFSFLSKKVVIKGDKGSFIQKFAEEKSLNFELKTDESSKEEISEIKKGEAISQTAENGSSISNDETNKNSSENISSIAENNEASIVSNSESANSNIPIITLICGAVLIIVIVIAFILIRKKAKN